MATQKINNTFIVSEQGDTLKNLLTIDPTDKNTSSGIGRFKDLKITNTSDQPVELQIDVKDFSTNDVAASGNVINTTLCYNESIMFPHSKLFLYTANQSAGFKTGTGGDGATATFLYPTQTGITDSGATVGTQYTSGATTLAVSDSDPFKVNDYIKIENEVLKVTAIATNTLTVEGAQLGTSAATHSSSTQINLFYINEQSDGTTFVKTNARGFYSANNFVGQGRNTAMPMGIVPGSVAIQLASPAYQEFGLTDQTSNTDTGLAASTIFSFNITPDNASSATQINFTTDATNTNWGGANGVLEKINEQFEDNFKSGTFVHLPIIEIINGDIRVSSGSRINKGTTAQSSAMLLAAPSSGTSIFGQKRIPAIGDINTPVTSKLAGNDKSKANEFIFDNGKGLLSGSIGSGKIN